VPATRRDFLTAASAALRAAGCGVGGGSPSVETFAPALAAGRQRLDPQLQIMVPPQGVAATTIATFQRETGVHVSVTLVHTDEAMLLNLAAGAGKFDAVLVTAQTLGIMVEQQQVEPLAGQLVSDRGDIHSPFDDPPVDPGLRHSVPQDYTYDGVVLDAGTRIASDTWQAFFKLPTTYPDRVLVPDNPDSVIGAALIATGHDWNSDSDADLADADALLSPLRGSLRVVSGPARIGRGLAVAALSVSLDQRNPPHGVRFFVPGEGTVVFARHWAIPVYAPGPVSANLWLANAIEPGAAALQSATLDRATPVQDAIAHVPTDLLANPAVYPPSDQQIPLVYPNLTDEGLAKRAALWRELGL
jgi:spermidine/putrescine-binding protein